MRLAAAFLLFWSASPLPPLAAQSSPARTVSPPPALTLELPLPAATEELPPGIGVYSPTLSLPDIETLSVEPLERAGPEVEPAAARAAAPPWAAARPAEAAALGAVSGPRADVPARAADAAERDPLAGLFDGSYRRRPGVELSAAAAPLAADADSPESPAERIGRVRAFAPHAVTGLNLASGFGAIIEASQGHSLAAAGLIILANLFDMLDGRTARALKVAGPMGTQLDSLADMVSFGAAPAFLAYQAALRSWGPPGIAASILFAFAGAYRLARFNVAAADPRHRASDDFTGLPIPGGAGVLVAAVVALPALPGAWALPALALTSVVASAAMVSTLPYPAFKHGGLGAILPPAFVGVVAALSLGALGLYRFVPAGLFGLYMASGPLNTAYRGGDSAFKTEAKRKAFHLATLLYLAAYLVLGHPLALYAMAAWMAVVAAIETARLKSESARGLLHKVFGGIIREKELNRYTGTFYVSLGVLGTFLLFGSHPHIVAASLLCLAFADALSALAGLRWGRHAYTVFGERRTLEGSVAGFVTAFLSCLLAGFHPFAAGIGAAAFSLADNALLKPDDNLWIPLAVGTALFLLGVA